MSDEQVVAPIKPILGLVRVMMEQMKLVVQTEAPGTTRAERELTAVVALNVCAKLAEGMRTPEEQATVERITDEIVKRLKSPLHHA